MSITFERLLPPPYIRPPQIPAGVFSFDFIRSFLNRLAREKIISHLRCYLSPCLTNETAQGYGLAVCKHERLV
jgi:hypothetical protein